MLPTIKIPYQKTSRSVMPQIEDVGAFLEWASSRGLHYKWETKEPVALHPTQGEINLGRVFKILDSGLDTKKFPIVLSQYNRILDGHHRWYGAVVLRDKVQCVRLLSSHSTVCALAAEWPGVKKEGIDDVS